MKTFSSQLLNKVPELTLVFWMIKILGTTVGETAADFLAFNLHLGLTNTSLLMAALLIAALFFQIRQERYVPAIYWTTVVLISIVGTLITDDLVEQFGVPLEVTTIAFSLLLVLTFAIWKRSEKTLSVHTIYTTKRELFYWSAILFTFALGTSAGDLISEKLHLGYLLSAALFLSVIILILFAYGAFRMNTILTFWLTYILTRPLGASCGDLLTQPAKYGGLGFSTSTVSIVFFACILVLVIYLGFRENQRLKQQ
jgi:uncharacterized membrane-anchored protein